MQWDFDFNWQRLGSEGTYQLLMQLGNGATMNDNDQNAGIGVNLVWRRLGSTHQLLSYRTGAGDTGIVQISGPVHLTVDADLDAQTYEVRVDDALVATGIPFHNAMLIDTVRLLTDGLNETTNAADDELGHYPIEKVIARDAGRPLRELQSAILDLAQGHGEQEDDRTLLLVRLR